MTFEYVVGRVRRCYNHTTVLLRFDQPSRIVLIELLNNKFKYLKGDLSDMDNHHGRTVM